jgi:MoaA/NifB/PqqE/SkfB family radical SAM enzyme
LEEYRKLSENFGHISILLLSGGEPFLRNDLVEICGTFIKNNSINNLLIPTNGLLTQKIVEVTKILASKFPTTIISINPSLDGMQVYHDMLRGVKECFSRAVTTIRELEKVKKEYKNVQIIVNSVIHKDNIDELKKLIAYLSEFNIDYHAFEIMRGDWKDKNLKLADIDELKDLHKLVIEYRKKRINNFFEKIIVVGTLQYIHKIKEDFLLGKKWPFLCSAGRSILVIYPNGDVSLCELKNPIGNLRDENYDIKRILDNEKALKMLGEISRDRCSCTHICFLNASFAKEWRAVFKILFYYFKK